MVVAFRGPGVIRRYRIMESQVSKAWTPAPGQVRSGAGQVRSARHAKAPAAAAALSHRANQRGAPAAGACVVVSGPRRRPGSLLT